TRTKPGIGPTETNAGFAVARTFIFYQIATSRGSDVLHRLLGPTFAGILGSDRLPSYLRYAADQRQFCWSHFTRNLLSAQELAETPAAKRFCREALALQKRLFRLWHRFRGDLVDPTSRACTTSSRRTSGGRRCCTRTAATS